MKPKFKKRYLLGEGYPIINICFEDVSLCNTIANTIKLKFPKELDENLCPKYRLVLERVK